MKFGADSVQSMAKLKIAPSPSCRVNASKAGLPAKDKVLSGPPAKYSPKGGRASVKRADTPISALRRSKRVSGHPTPLIHKKTVKKELDDVLNYGNVSRNPGVRRTTDSLVNEMIESDDDLDLDSSSDHSTMPRKGHADEEDQALPYDMDKAPIESAADRSTATVDTINTRENDLSLSAFLSKQRDSVSNIVQRLENIIRTCDSSLNDALTFKTSEKNNLSTCLRNAEAVKARLDKAKEVERNTVAMGGEADSDDGLPDKQFADLVKSAAVYRESAQKAYDGKRAIVEAVQTEVKAREEGIARLEVERKNALVGIREWAEWRGNGGKIFE